MLKEKKQQGFTIIEVVIVLVIGAIIMLMVFLVVPYLQRTQRDSRRQNDARRLLTAVEQFAANNGGTAPVQSDAGKLIGSKSSYITETFSDPSTNTTYTVNFVTGAGGPVTKSTDIIVSTGGKCASPNDGSIVAGNGRAISVFQENGKAVCIGG